MMRRVLPTFDLLSALTGQQRFDYTYGCTCGVCCFCVCYVCLSVS